MISEAISDFEAALRLKPDYVIVFNILAWLYATCPQAEFRNGAKAVENAKKACELTDWKEPNFLDSLGAAYAEVGDFEQAVKWQKTALDLLPESAPAKTRAARESRLKLFQEDKPFRDSH